MHRVLTHSCPHYTEALNMFNHRRQDQHTILNVGKIDIAQNGPHALREERLPAVLKAKLVKCTLGIRIYQVICYPRSSESNLQVETR